MYFREDEVRKPLIQAKTLCICIKNHYVCELNENPTKNISL